MGEGERADLGRRIERDGLERVARQLGVSPLSAVKAYAGLPLNKALALMISSMLAAIEADAEQQP